MRAGDPFAQKLKRSSFLVIDTDSVGPNLDILRRHRIDGKGRAIKDSLGNVEELSDDDSVDPKENYQEDREVDMFESFDADDVHACDRMKEVKARRDLSC